MSDVNTPLELWSMFTELPFDSCCCPHCLTFFNGQRLCKKTVRQARKINGEVAVGRRRWRKLIKDD